MTRDQAVAAAREIDELFLAPLKVSPARHDDGIGTPHLRWMVEQMTEMSENKTQRWLGYIQGVLVVQRRATLDQMKDVIRRALSTGQDR